MSQEKRRQRKREKKEKEEENEKEKEKDSNKEKEKEKKEKEKEDKKEKEKEKDEKQEFKPSECQRKHSTMQAMKDASSPKQGPVPAITPAGKSESKDDDEEEEQNTQCKTPPEKAELNKMPSEGAESDQTAKAETVATKESIFPVGNLK